MGVVLGAAEKGLASRRDARIEITNAMSEGG